MQAAEDGVIQVSNLSFSYYGSERAVLNKINISVKKGEIVLIVGHSGSGKSTLLRAINGLIPHQHGGEYSGEVIVDGMKVSESSMSNLATKVGYIFQNPENQIFMFSVERDIAFGLENLGVAQEEMRERVDWALELLQIKHLALRAPHELSDGQKQRVAIAGVIAMKPKILILDEPTSLLDPFTAKTLVELVKNLRSTLGITVLIVEHRLDLVAKICDRIVVMDKGGIVLSGSPKEVLSDPNVSVHGVTEPTIVKLAKSLSLGGSNIPVDPEELRDSLGQIRTNRVS
ncbi:MAG TPA: ATP-binding cassette domain-containing protein [Nitrososphaerales archaeon]|nr:ATP-binding cassette domain-containing protein [Nitrososphaerales archaeon]